LYYLLKRLYNCYC